MRTSVDVHNFLVEQDVPHEVFSARGRLRTPALIATALDLPIDEVGRVLIFEGSAGEVAAVIPADAEPDPGSLKKATGHDDLEPASDDRAFELTGYLPESIPPAGLPSRFTTVIDRSLARDDVLYFPGGEARAVLKIRGKDLVRATRARVASLVRRTHDRQ